MTTPVHDDPDPTPPTEIPPGGVMVPPITIYEPEPAVPVPDYPPDAPRNTDLDNPPAPWEEPPRPPIGEYEPPPPSEDEPPQEGDE